MSYEGLCIMRGPFWCEIFGSHQKLWGMREYGLLMRYEGVSCILNYSSYNKGVPARCSVT